MTPGAPPAIALAVVLAFGLWGCSLPSAGVVQGMADLGRDRGGPDVHDAGGDAPVDLGPSADAPAPMDLALADAVPADQPAGCPVPDPDLVHVDSSFGGAMETGSRDCPFRTITGALEWVRPSMGPVSIEIRGDNPSPRVYAQVSGEIFPLRPRAGVSLHALPDEEVAITGVGACGNQDCSVLIESGDVHLENLRLVGAMQGAGVVITAGGDMTRSTITRCEVTSFDKAGVELSEGALTLANTSVTSNNDGLLVRNADLNVNGCDVSNNRDDGLDVAGQSTVVSTTSSYNGNMDAGLRVIEGSRCESTGDTMQFNLRGAVAGEAPNHQPRLKLVEAEIHGNETGIEGNCSAPADSLFCLIVAASNVLDNNVGVDLLVPFASPSSPYTLGDKDGESLGGNHLQTLGNRNLLGGLCVNFGVRGTDLSLPARSSFFGSCAPPRTASLGCPSAGTDIGQVGNGSVDVTGCLEEP
jgi:hypothetical protein